LRFLRNSLNKNGLRWCFLAFGELAECLAEWSVLGDADAGGASGEKRQMPRRDFSFHEGIVCNRARSADSGRDYPASRPEPFCALFSRILTMLPIFAD
jgi:hypothetical protein